MDGVIAHYSTEGLAARLLAALEAHCPEASTANDLAPIDEFHLRGREATLQLAELAEIQPGDRVLDIGCGVGGPARKLAAARGCEVVGIDLTPEFIEAASALSRAIGMDKRIQFEAADALALPFADSAFDVAWTQHVSMNIPEKPALFREMRRVLRPCGRLALHEIVAGEGEPTYPVPWAAQPGLSHLLPPERMGEAIASAGFAIRIWSDVTDVSREWLEGAMPRVRSASPFGLHLVVGDRLADMLENLSQNLHQGRVRVVMAVADAI